MCDICNLSFETVVQFLY